MDAPGIEVAKVPALKSGAPVAIKGKAVSFVGWFWIIVVEIVVVYTVFSVLTATPKEPTAEDQHGTQRDAAAAAQLSVTQFLRCPSTAKFPPLGTMTVTPYNNGSFLVRSYCDSQNAFGAMLRTGWECVVWRRTDGNWEGYPSFDKD